MIYPIHVIGSQVLRQTAKDIDKNYPDLAKFIEDMKETMYNSAGVGLAAPQVGKPIRLFVIDTTPMNEDNKEEGVEKEPDIKKVFINAKIVERFGDIMTYDEGCLSVPGIREEVDREEKIRIQYYDENFNFFDEEYTGIASRVIQHEYDHLEGKLFTDRLWAIRKKLLQRKLGNVSKGEFEAKYKTVLGTPIKKRR